MLKRKFDEIYSQGKQLTIDDFRSSLEGLSPSNRWVRLGNILPWDEIERVYNSRLNNRRTGVGNKPARMVVGALIVKHKCSRSHIWNCKTNLQSKQDQSKISRNGQLLDRYVLLREKYNEVLERSSLCPNFSD